jgi:alpha-L-arabinofuranosidase
MTSIPERRLGDQRAISSGASCFLRQFMPLFLLIPLLASTAGCQSKPAATTTASNPSGPTNISISTRVIRSNVKRLGMNMSGQSFYDSGQMLRDLTFRNPGFEGQIWQTILQCKFVNGDSCADNDEWSGWPADFAKGGTFEFFYGAAKGEAGTVAGNTVAASAAHQGVWISFGHLAVHPQVGDFYIVRMKMPGNAPAGWRITAENGATVTTEMHDISPNSPGKQAVRLEASASQAQFAAVNSDFDSWEDHSFLQLKGTYTLSFRAKTLGGKNGFTAMVTRLSKRHGNITYLDKEARLTNQWQDFKFTFEGREDGSYNGPIAVTLGIRGGAALLDDASLVESAASDNPTAFRNAVVDRLRELRPGILRYMDNGTSFGSSIDNLIAVPYARQRAGYSEGDKVQLDIPIGINEFLVLCQAVKADPWISLPAGMTTEGMRHLIEFLSGPASTPYGAKRAALGQSAPWSSVFSNIHLELGNETWNGGSFPGEGIPEPKAYATLVSEAFAIAKTAPYYDANKYDLIMNGWFGVPWWNEQELSIRTHADTIDIAPYTFNLFNDASNTEAIFGPMLAEPEALDSRPTGLVAQQAKVAAKGGVKLAIYEVNLGTTQGKVDQGALDSAIPSLGAGISVAEHMLLMMRDDNVSVQALFCLPEYGNGFSNSDKPTAKELSKLWGSVVDMGGETNRVRPTFLAEALANTAIADKMLEVSQSGSNPTWDQPESANAKIKLAGAHKIQSFAFTDGTHASVVLFNLTRNASLPVIFSGAVTPHGTVKVSRLTSANITDSNEESEKVKTKTGTLENFDPNAPYALPPFSMTVLTWDASGAHFAGASTSHVAHPTQLATKP